MSSRHYACAVVGDWHLAFVTAACLADLGHRTVMVSPGGERPDGHEDSFPAPPVLEPGLPEMIARAQAAGTLHHASGIAGHWSADVVWLAIDTPVDSHDEPDVAPLLSAARAIAHHRCCRAVFVVTSQVPVGFCDALEDETGLTVACVPENLRLGSGIESFLRADRKVVGARTPGAAATVARLLEGVRADLVTCDLATAEMIKHATNAFLATSISFANELARLGETAGADGHDVARALKLDRRIGPRAYVEPGLGFAGGTLPRDLRVLQRRGRQHRVPTPLVDAVLEVNAATASALLEAIDAYVGGVEGRTVLVLGYTYKADTDTLRRSPSLDLARVLRERKARVLGFDPSMNARDLSELHGLIEHRAAWSDVGEMPDAVVVMTPRREFAELAWSSLRRPARDRPPLVLDARGALGSEAVLRAGCAYKALWRPVKMPAAKAAGQ